MLILLLTSCLMAYLICTYFPNDKLASISFCSILIKKNQLASSRFLVCDCDDGLNIQSGKFQQTHVVCLTMDYFIFQDM